MGAKYIVRLLIITVILLASAWLIDSYVEKITLPAVVYFIIIGFTILTWMLHRFVMSANKTSPQRFVAHFMGSITVKLFASIAFLVIYLYLVKAHKVEVAISLLTTYMVFTFFEVVTMQGLLRGK
jgi:hypothetical protein